MFEVKNNHIFLNCGDDGMMLLFPKVEQMSANDVCIFTARRLERKSNGDIVEGEIITQMTTNATANESGVYDQFAIPFYHDDTEDWEEGDYNWQGIIRFYKGTSYQQTSTPKYPMTVKKRNDQ